MKKQYLVLTIVLMLAVIVAVFFIYNNGKTSTECSKKGDYCVYKVSSFLKYSQVSGLLPSDDSITPFQGNLSDYLIKGSAISGDWKSYRCVFDNEPPLVLDYFYYICNDKDIDGCGHSRKAIICGTSYFVEDFSSSFGPVLYGPFLTPEPN